MTLMYECRPRIASVNALQSLGLRAPTEAGNIGSSEENRGPMGEGGTHRHWIRLWGKAYAA